MYSHKFSLRNFGQTATNVRIQYSGGGAPNSISFEHFNQERDYSEVLEYATDYEFKMEISFEDASGEPGVTYIDFKVTKHRLHIGRPETVQ